MRDISKYTPNAQKYIRYGWAACDAASDKEELRRILNERNAFCDENFTLEDYDSMIQASSGYTPECQAWERAKERYITEHQQVEVKGAKNENIKTPTKCIRKTI